MNKPLVYISGKIAGLDQLDTKIKFRRAAMAMRRKGYDVVNPYALGTCQTFDWADYVIRDLFYLRRCTAIYMLPDWQDSPGARVEHAFAQGLNLEIIYAKEEEE